jgi:hypothetical protein
MKKGVSFRNGKAKTGNNNIFRQFGKWMIVGICVILFAVFFIFSGFKEGAGTLKPVTSVGSKSGLKPVTSVGDKSGANVAIPAPTPPQQAPPTPDLSYLNNPNAFKVTLNSDGKSTNPFQLAFPNVWKVFLDCYRAEGRNEGNAWSGNIDPNNQLGNTVNIYPLIFARADGKTVPKLVQTDGTNPKISDMEIFENNLKTNPDKTGKSTMLSLNGVQQSNTEFNSMSLYAAFAKVFKDGPVKR